MSVSKAEQVEINVVGSSTFGRYPKISLEKTFNMFLSDQWLVNYAGFKKVLDVSPEGEGRGLFYSVRGGFLLAVVSSSVYVINSVLGKIFIGTINTSVGDVFIDENLDSQICIVDGISAYIFHYPDNTLTQQILTFFPSYVCYHNTFFLLGSSPASTDSSSWYVFEPNTTTTIQLVIQLALQTKPDVALAVERLPGRGNNVLVMGSTVAEVWTQVAGPEVYRRVQSFNIDYGLVAISTLAANEEQICWLGQNENNSPTIITTDGSNKTIISSDGIDQVLDRIKFPQQSAAFFYRQDGHLFYQLTFHNPVDNLTLIYDFTTNKFFHVSDQNLNYHPARQIVFFQEATYFISINDGSLYQMDTNFITYNYDIDPNTIGDEIPRIRICKSVRKKDSGTFRVGQFTFWLEQGVIPANSPIPARVDMSFSKNGNQSFSNIVSKVLNPTGVYRNQIRWWRMGQANEFTIQLRFYGFQRFVTQNGILEMY